MERGDISGKGRLPLMRVNNQTDKNGDNHRGRGATVKEGGDNHELGNAK